MRPKRTPQSSALWFTLLAAMACGPSGNASSGQEPNTPDSPVLHPIPAAVRPGLDVFLTDSVHLVQGMRVGLITNHTGLDREGVHGIDRLVAAPEVNLVALFSPEHGIRGEAEAGIEIDSAQDPSTGLRIHSLYGATLKPTPEMLEEVDILLFDIQDVGARFYTYVSTMAKAMEAAGEAGIPLVVLDRPNPIGGVSVQGGVLDPAYSTFVGLYPIPMRHGMTPAELARLFVGEFDIRVDLSVVPVEGWRRDMTFTETGLPWVPLSPNMPSVESATHYPGTCLFEGTNVSVGRGTDVAFQVLGAPWLDGGALVAAMADYDLPGVEFQTHSFTPEAPGDGKFPDETLHGIRLAVTGPDYNPSRTAVAILKETHAMAGEEWVWHVAHFDRLAGTDELREGLEAGLSLDALVEGWDQELATFLETRAGYLIY